MSPPRIREIIFCDDIRKEEGNKRSIMGVYTNYLFTTSNEKPPLVMPSLAIFVRMDGIQGGEKIFVTTYLGNKKLREYPPIELKKMENPDDITHIAIHINNFEIPEFGKWVVTFGLNSRDNILGEGVLNIQSQR